MSSTFTWHMVLVLVMFLTCTLYTETQQTRVTLDNNGYVDILVSIDEAVTENVQIIDKIKELFTEGSAALYEATRNRAYFKRISILIPEQWSDSPDYVQPTFEQPHLRDIIIDYPNPSIVDADTPYVYRVSSCGGHDGYMHLTPDYLLDSSVNGLYGPIGKLLIHEWGHLRYGLFDEYPNPGINVPVYYLSPTSGQYEPTRCSKDVTGTWDSPCTVDANGQPSSENCYFRDDQSAAATYTGSIMYRQSLPNLKYYCDDSNNAEAGNIHNDEAPTRQNQLCSLKSAWEVMRENVDFANGANPPRTVTDTTPEFRLVKQTVRRTVLVLDVSGSMSTDNRIQTLGQAVNTYLTLVAEGEFVGMVEFDTTASTLSSLLEIDATNRATLIGLIPDYTKSSTSIGAGILKGIEVLEGNGADPACGRLIVITDGEENQSPYIADVEADVMAKNIKIISMGLGISSSELTDTLAISTGGSIFYADGLGNSLTEAFITIDQQGKSIIQQHIQLYSDTIEVATSEVITVDVDIDSSIGKSTTFTFNYEYSSIPEITVTSPTGVVIDENSSEYTHNAQFKTISILIQGIAEAGTWSVSISNPTLYPLKVKITITSMASDPNLKPIATEAFWSNAELLPPEKISLHATVSQGYSPVLNAEVTATIDGPAGVPIVLTLKDNGAGADIQVDDGVYSSYFTQLEGNGKYGVKIDVTQKSTTVISPGKILGFGGGGLINPDYASEEKEVPDIPTEKFTRIANGGSFSCSNSLCSAGDVYPPTRIIDLVVADTAEETITIQFTAPGDDLDQGNATYYEIWIHNKFTDMKNNYNQTEKLQDFHLIGGSVNEPRMAGERESFTIKVLPHFEFEVYVIAVTAVDDEGNTSPLSNIVTSKTSAPESNLLLIIILTVVIALTILVAVAICIVCLKMAKKTKVVVVPIE